MSQAQVTTTSQLKQLSDGNVDGTTFGQSTSDLISFYGVTPVAQQAATGGVPITTACVTTGGYMFATSSQAAQFISALVALQKVGLIG